MTVPPESPPEEELASVAADIRSETIASLGIVDGAADPDFTRISVLAARLLGAPIGFVGLLDGEQVRLHSPHGVALEVIPSRHGMTEALVTNTDLTSVLIPDARADSRFAQSALVTGPPGARFCAGVPIMIHGLRVGALCVLDPKPRTDVDPKVLDDLNDLAALAGSLFGLKDEARVRARMAAELIKEEWRHALTLEAGRVGSWVWDLRSGEIVANDIFRQVFGLNPGGQLHIEDVMSAIDPADVASVNYALSAAFDQGIDYAAEFRVTATERWLIGRGRVYQRDGSGKPLIMMGVNIDVTDAREAAEQTRLLLRELNHRVKNTLAMIQSLARQTLRQKPNPQEFIDAFSGRLRTLSEAHVLLSDRDWSGIALMELIDSQVRPYVLNSGDQLVTSGADVRLPPDHALGLGLIFHELTSNAARFGALSTPRGRVTIEWTVTSAHRLVLGWRESGGPPVAVRPEAGFGTRLIERSLDKVLDSTVRLSFAPEGLAVDIDLPLD